MAGFIDMLGTMVQLTMSQSSGSRMTNDLGAKIIVKALINAAKADNRIDETEI